MIDNKSPTAAVGRRIKVRRAELGLSQAQLAGADLSDSYISLLESGRRAPSEDVMATLADRLRCSQMWLRSGLDEAALRTVRLRLREAELQLRTGGAAAALEITQEVATSDAADRETQEHARFLEGCAFEALGKLDRAIDIFSDVIEAAEREGDEPSIAATVALSRCLREAGDVAAAIDVARVGLRRLERDGAPPDEQFVELSATLLAGYIERGDFATAQRLADQNIAAADVIGLPLSRGSAYWNAMVVAAESGRLSDAERYGDRALALYGETDGARNLARLKVAYGWLLMRLNPPRPSSALTILETASEEIHHSGSVVDQAYLCTEKARALLHLGKLDSAEQAAQQSIDLLGATSAAVPIEFARSAAVLAMIELAKEEKSAAGSHIEQAATALNDVGVSRNASEVWRELGEIALTTGNQDVATQAFRNALDCVGVSAPVEPTAHALAHSRLPAEPAATTV